MAQISVTVPHRLQAEEALQRIQSALQEATRTYGDRLQESSFQWTDRVLAYRFQAMGLTFQGTLRVEEALVVVEAEVPQSAWLFRGMIEQQIHQRLSQLLR